MCQSKYGKTPLRGSKKSLKRGLKISVLDYSALWFSSPRRQHLHHGDPSGLEGGQLGGVQRRSGHNCQLGDAVAMELLAQLRPNGRILDNFRLSQAWSKFNHLLPAEPLKGFKASLPVLAAWHRHQK
jgi:hypothetical protein